MEDERDDSDVDLSLGARLLAELSPCCRSTWLWSYKNREKARLQSVCKCLARPAGDDEDGGHLSEICREEEMPIEAGVDVLSKC